MHKTIVIAAMLGFATFGLQACSSESNPTGQQQYSQNHSGRMVCDANGNNCRPCDANNSNCQVTATKSFWGFFF